MHQKVQRRASQIVAQTKRPADEEEITIWRIEKFEAVLIPKETYGEFFEGDSYIVEYTWRVKGKLKEAILYYWQGSDSSNDEKGASALLVTKFDDERFHGDATQIRVVQGKEPSSFLSMFNGNMVIHKGGCESGFRKSGAPGSADEPSSESVAQQFPKFYHIRGQSPCECKGIEVTPEAKFLNSNDAFVLLAPKGALRNIERI
jgi:hypothetical protein